MVGTLPVRFGREHSGGAFVFSSIAQIGLAAALGSGAAVAMTQSPAPPRQEAPAQLERPRSTTPPLGWRGVEKVAILCQVTSEKAVGSDVATTTLCNRVRAIAAQGAPVPVETIGYSDPALRAPGTAVLFAQASIAEVAPERLALVLTVRAEQNGAADEAKTFFGAAPRVAPFTSAADGAAWDGAIAAALSEVLPWQRPAGTGDLLPIE